MTPERLDELERAATLLTREPKPRGHRCGGVCPRCMPWRVASATLTHAATLELIQEVRRLRGEVALLREPLLCQGCLEPTGAWCEGCGEQML